MAEIKPFRGYRYRLEKPSDLGRFVAPPYDMLNDESVEDLYRSDPHNVVRIIQNKREEGDADNRARHARAARLFRSWVGERVLVRDERPSLYVYRQSFTNGDSAGAPAVERTGIVAAVALHDFADGVILPHENTLSAPKADRYEHLQEMHCHTEKIFGIVTDDGPVYDAVIACRDKGDPAGSFTDADGVRHSLAAVSDATLVGRAAAAVAGRQILIADGHHRYETSLKFARESGIAGSGYVMMTLVSMRDPGLVVRSFHRLVRVQPGVPRTGLLDALAKVFTVERCGDGALDETQRLVDSLGPQQLLLLAPSSGCYRLSLSESGRRVQAASSPGMSQAWKDLNVSIVNSVVVNHVLGLPLDGKTLHDEIRYEKSVGAAHAAALAGREFYGCFFLRPIDLSAIRAIVAAGERMPQKSTNFFPKMYSGLVFNPLGES